MKKVLWLTSWYPNRQDKMNGDFIQRHAKAVSLFCKVNVIHVEAAHKNFMDEPVNIEVNTDGNLQETIILYNPKTFLPFIKRLNSYFTYLHIFKKQIRNYIKENGKPDIVHVQVPVKAGLPAMWLKKKYQVPFVVTEHWAIYNNWAPDNYSRRNSLFRFFTKKIFQQASLFMPVSNELGKAVGQMVAPVDFTVVSNVADTNYFFYDPLKKKPGFSFIHVSTMNYQKNAEGILRSFSVFLKQHPSANLVMTGPHNKELIHLSETLKIPSANISFTGNISYPAVAKMMQESHALILFSRYENLPCVIPEALCCGLPVIATDVGGIAEIVNKENGLLVKSGNEDALVKSMLALYDNYSQFDLLAISQKAILSFSYMNVGSEICDLYSKVITGIQQ